ncbi:hypothetical protein [Nocardia sp. NPDC002869]|uniref:hypothetical protein n=1 Tax=Nocardia sp. NPDC002869 TaxID=3161032 RepID=UPI00398CC722
MWIVLNGFDERRVMRATVITGLIGLIALAIAGYAAVYTWPERAESRRRGAAAHRNHEGRRGR